MNSASCSAWPTACIHVLEPAFAAPEAIRETLDPANRSRGGNSLKQLSAIRVLGFVVTVALTMPATVHANTIIYSDSPTFQAALGSSVTDRRFPSSSWCRGAD